MMHQHFDLPLPDVVRLSEGEARGGGAQRASILADALEAGRGKLAAKERDKVVVNDATEAGAGFGGDTNRVSFVHASGREGGQATAVSLLEAEEVEETDRPFGVGDSKHGMEEAHGC